MSKSNQEILERIRKRRREFAEKKAAEKAKHENVQANQISESANPEPDYMQLCRVYQKKFDCSPTEAMRQIDKIVPLARSAYIEKVNRERDAENTPPSIAFVDGKDFMQMVTFLKLNHGMSTIEAHRHIDKNWSGLRQGYIDKCNK